MKKLLLLLAAVITFTLSAMAQNQRVTGVVYGSDSDDPLVGATVVGVGTSVGTVTDIDGNFSLSLPASVKKLSVSYVGMKTQEVAITPGTPMTITLESTNKLDEVITVAYGTAKRSAFTGSASVLDASEIESVQVSNPVEALKGKVAGVQMTSASGAPGSSPTIRIRGISSINAGNSPLIIVDGAPYSGDLNNISSQDIESMTVLKDAASNALYGARGANGVILVTTKKGKGNAKVTLDAKWGSNSRATKDYKVIKDPRLYYNTYAQALANYKLYAGGLITTEDVRNYVESNLIWGGKEGDTSGGLGYNIWTVPEGERLIGEDYKVNPNATIGRTVNYNGMDYLITPDDWADAAYGNALRQEYNLSVSQSTDKSNFYLSASYLNDEGIVRNTNLERFTGRLSADIQAKPWLKVGANMSYTHFSSKSSDDDGDSASSGNIFAVANQLAPIYPLYVRDGEGTIMTDQYGMQMYDYGDGENGGFSRPTFSGTNPLQAMDLDVNKAEGNAFNALGFAEVRFLKDFKFTSNNSVSIDETRFNQVTNPYYGMYKESNGIASVQHQRTIDYTYQQLLTWTREFGLHNVNVLLGHENYWQKGYILYATQANMLMPDNEELSGCITESGSGSYRTDYNNEGWLGRVNYDYDNRYFVSASIRRDGSSRFHPDHRWGTFWSAGAGWLLSSESFFNADWVDMLKIKASYGEQGNDNINNYLYTNVYTIENSNGVPSAVPSTMGNKNITWEKGGNFNAGVDFSFWNERLGGSVEYFYRKTSDMLSRFPLPPSFGYTSYWRNVGDMVNNGVEVDIHGDIIRMKNFTWSANANLTFYKNKITSLPEWSKNTEGHTLGDPNKTVHGYSGSGYFWGEGQPLYTFYTLSYAGPDENGQSTWWRDVTETRTDAQGNDYTVVTGKERTTSVSQATEYLCGSALPSCYGGFGTSFEAYGFDFAIDFTYQIGGKCMDSTYASLMGSPNSNGRGGAMHQDILNSWSPDNHTSNIPRLCYEDIYNGYSSDRFITDASYLALQSINFGYTIPAKVTKKIQVDKIRVYLSADNVALWSKRQGLDPRQSLSGSVTNAYYAPIRKVSGGINVTF